MMWWNYDEDMSLCIVPWYSHTLDGFYKRIACCFPDFIGCCWRSAHVFRVSHAKSAAELKAIRLTHTRGSIFTEGPGWWGPPWLRGTGTRGISACRSCHRCRTAWPHGPVRSSGPARSREWSPPACRHLGCKENGIVIGIIRNLSDPKLTSSSACTRALCPGTAAGWDRRPCSGRGPRFRSYGGPRCAGHAYHSAGIATASGI